MDSTIAVPLNPDDPQEIGQFTIIGLLGTGGMGEVYLGTADEGYVAVKRVRPRLVTGERFKREVGILYRVPVGVAPGVLAHDSTAARPWFATEYVPGLTVDDAVRLHGPLPVDALWLLLAETAAQLRAVHEVGIVHRDLKPANLMLVRDGVKLIDFGIARAADLARLTRSGESYGTRGFIAPEQEAGDPDVASPVDVYSLGALLLFAASGRTPGVVPDIEPVRALDADLATIVESCLAADPEARPSAAELVASARDHVIDTDACWPPEVMERIAARRKFAATPVGKLDTVPPPEREPESEPKPGPETGFESAPAKPRRRFSLWPIAVVVVVGAVVVGYLGATHTPFTGQHASTATRSTKALVAAGAVPKTPTGTADANSSGTASGAASTTPTPGTTTSTTTATTSKTTAPIAATATTRVATAAAANPTASSINGIDGGADSAQVPGSEADTYWVGNDAACSAWLDDNGSGKLAGVLNTSLTQSCVAELFRSDGIAYTFSASVGAEKTNYISDIGYTMQICVWHADEQSSTEVCSSHFGMNGDTPVKG